MKRMHVPNRFYPVFPLVMLVVGCSKKEDAAVQPPGPDWSMVTSGTTASLGSVQFTSAITGYVCGFSAAENSFVLRTTDAGATWSKQTAFSPLFCSVTVFLSDNVGFSVGDSGYIFRTTNGGVAWTSLRPGSELLWALDFPSANVGYAAGIASILKTTNSGATWAVITTGKGGVAARFLNDSAGYVVGANIHKTTDGGSTWSATPSPTGNILTDVIVIDAANAMVTEHGGNILKTTNGGQTWSTISVGVSTALRGIARTTAGTIYVCGDNGVIRKSSDNSATWVAENSGSTALLNDITFTSSGVGFVVGFQGAILKRNP